MIRLLTLAIRLLLSHYKITDKGSCRTFLLRFVARIKSHAVETGTTIDEAFLRHIEFILKDGVLFDYAYSVIFEQLQTEEILFESAEEETIVWLVENAAAYGTEPPEAINPAVIVSLITRIISLINSIKNR